MAEYLWLLLVAGGPILLGVVIGYSMMKRRRLTRPEADAQERKIDRMYEKP